MSAVRILSGVEPIWRLVHESTGVALSSSMRALGLERDGQLVAGVLYEGWNKSNVWMHVAILPGHTFTRRFVHTAFEYPFGQVGVNRATAWVDVSNRESTALVRRIGFEHEALLKGAANDGGDVVLWVMRKERCRWLRHAPNMAGCGTSKE